ncbi:hypothetical protein H696_00096 [Fonticula alba]|uniref:Uncharacterized protein n=1 Tax=Fonticula alba TaxID=691883 RepID=A0A058ZEY5_FONAL|nr:hypothetical protein H696_00096 [Fonticula alba]KCV72501.1 hypothetical protein H696_00096 [Fonticula alba]|eukprot:XP_009492202.1 hypothetical protein H696_00096 [Fonticula alba]
MHPHAPAHPAMSPCLPQMGCAPTSVPLSGVRSQAFNRHTVAAHVDAFSRTFRTVLSDLEDQDLVLSHLVALEVDTAVAAGPGGLDKVPPYFLVLHRDGIDSSCYQCAFILESSSSLPDIAILSAVLARIVAIAQNLVLSPTGGTATVDQSVLIALAGSDGATVAYYELSSGVA